MAPIPLLLVTSHELVVCKPPGLASEHTRDPRADSLVARLRSAGYDDLRLVHRLDAPARGLMIVARTAAAAAHYSAEIEARRWKKVYIAEVAAAADRALTLIGDHKAHLGIDGKRATVVRSGGKPSFLTIAHAAPASTRGRSHLLVRLHTGRFHQIRVMLANLGAPLAGDAVYGGPAGDTIYLEHVLLAARPFNAATASVWRAPEHADRPAWSSSLADAVNAEEASLRREA